MSTAPLVPGSFTYSSFGGAVLVGVGIVVALDFSMSDEEDCADTRLLEKASANIRGRKRDLDGVVTWGFCARFGVERVGTGGWLAGDSLRESRLGGVGRGCERLKVRGREVGVAGGDGEAPFASPGNVVEFSWKTSITDHLLRLRVVLALPLLCDADSEVLGRGESSTS